MAFPAVLSGFLHGKEAQTHQADHFRAHCSEQSLTLISGERLFMLTVGSVLLDKKNEPKQGFSSHAEPLKSMVYANFQEISKRTRLAEDASQNEKKLTENQKNQEIGGFLMGSFCTYSWRNLAFLCIFSLEFAVLFSLFFGFFTLQLEFSYCS